MSNPSVQKRERERQQQDRRREREAKRKERRDDKPARELGDVDPDIAGIVPGPQPILDDDLVRP